MATHNTHRFYVEGMHCASCVLYLEETLKRDGITTVQASLSTQQVTITGDLGEDSGTLALQLSELVAPGGYRLLTEPAKKPKSYGDFLIALPAAAIVITGFILLQELGFVNLVSSQEVSYGTAAFIGLIASVSTCLAVVGGLVLALSANAAKNRSNWRSQALFHVGRLGGFFVLGGAIGSAGTFLHLGLGASAALGIVIALIMILLGLNLLDIFPSAKRFQPTLPKVFARHTVRASNSTHVIAPLLVGIGTFFLPCGFTQSMQIYTLSTGSFMTGGLTMLAFALGTLPVLALLSFGSLELSNKPWKGQFFKAAGLVVIVLACLNMWNALRALGIF